MFGQELFDTLHFNPGGGGAAGGLVAGLADEGKVIIGIVPAPVPAGPSIGMGM